MDRAAVAQCRAVAVRNDDISTHSSHVMLSMRLSRCERNYSTTTYLAEFWNAISSIPIFLFALIGYGAGKRYAMAETRSDKRTTETRARKHHACDCILTIRRVLALCSFSLTYFLIMLVGIGSFAFHATLRRYAQCMDELPMLWASIMLFYNVRCARTLACAARVGI